MKKRVLLVVLLSISLILITGCGKEKNVEETDSFTIKSESQEELLFTYPKRMSFQIKAQEHQFENSDYVYHYYEVYNPDYYFSMKLSLQKSGRTYYDLTKRSSSTAQGFKEYKWNGYEGFAYTDSQSVFFYVALVQDDKDYFTLLVGEGNSNNPHEEIMKVFNEEDLQNVLNTMTYKKPE
ncbi:MAG: hypothetical protein IJG68_00195 [Bacilli bacterium]|nr:hypothetical protein [Bacilli bacterium]